MDEKEQYAKLKHQMILLFQDYVDNHDLGKCIEYYHFLESQSQEDALVFSLLIIEKYVDELDHDIYDHIGCLVFHDGNNAMLHSLLKAKMNSKNFNVRNYLQDLIEVLVSGLQMTAINGTKAYTKEYLNELERYYGQYDKEPVF